MKGKVCVMSAALVLALCITAPRATPVRADDQKVISPYLTLLLSRAQTLSEVDVPATFSWQTTREVTINIQLLSDSPGTQGDPYQGKMVVSLYGDPVGDASFSEQVYTMITGTTGQLSATVSIPADWTQLKVVARDNSTTPPSTIIQLSSATSSAAINSFRATLPEGVTETVEFSLNPSDPGPTEQCDVHANQNCS